MSNITCKTTNGQWNKRETKVNENEIREEIQRSNEKKKEAASYEIHDNDVTIMSNVTCKTANSVWNKREMKVNENDDEINKNNNEKENRTTYSLESLGKTRRSRSKASDKEKSNSKNEPNNIDGKNESADKIDVKSVMSDITKEVKSIKQAETIDLVEEEENNDGTLMSEITADDTKRAKKETTRNIQSLKTPIAENTSGKVQNPYRSPQKPISGNANAQFTKASYVEVINENNNTNEDKKKENSANGNTANMNNYIRIRFQFKGKYGKQTTKAKIRDVLYHTMCCAKTIDKGAALMPWGEDTFLPTLNGDEFDYILKMK